MMTLPTPLPTNVSDQIVADCEGNVRKAILMLEALKMQSFVLYLPQKTVFDLWCRPDLSGPLSIAKPDWETYCHKVADLIVQEQTPARVMEVRAKFYELLSHCIPPTVILKVRIGFHYSLHPTDSLVDCSRKSC